MVIDGNHLIQTILVNTDNIRIGRELIECQHSLVSGAMVQVCSHDIHVVGHLLLVLSHMTK